MAWYDNLDFSSLQNNPMLQLGLGMLKASGPSTDPHNLGQDLASSYDYMTDAQGKNLKNKYLQSEMAKTQSEADRLKAWAAMFGNGALSGQQQGNAGPLPGLMANPQVKAIAPMIGMMGPDAGLKLLAEYGLEKPKDPPAGYRSVSGGNLEAIPGGPADVKVQAAKDKDTGALSSSIADMDRLASQANDILSAPGLDKNYGMMGMIPNRPGGDAANAQALFDTLKSQTAFNVLQNMKNNSKTGGAIGPVSNYEEKMLQDNLAALGKSQSSDQVREQLKKIIDYTEGAKGRANAAFNTKYGNPSSSQIPDMGQVPASQFAPDSILRGVQTTPAGQGLLSGQQPSGIPMNGANPNMPQGAKMGGDGKFYVPDPNRPGKYLMVQ